MAAFAGLSNHRERTVSASSTPDTDGTKRRSSSRNIKRPKFDDELVESSLGGQGLPPLPKFRARNPSLSVVDSPTRATPPTPTTPSITSDVRKRLNAKAQSTIQNKRTRKGKTSSTIPTKDLGRWKPSDDLTLIISVQQTCDLIAVHRGVKFSCKFTLGEIQDRWYDLLYDPTVSRVAQQAMKNLHPEQISAIQSKALYSKAEEELLASIKSNSAPVAANFESLLESHADIFHIGRTAKSLLAHWQLMKQYCLLQDQSPQPRANSAREFSEAEEQLVDSELGDVAVRQELAAANRVNKQKIRKLEDTVTHLSVLVDTVTGISPPDFDVNTLAVLRGRLVRYLMRSDNITLGRKAAGVNVDVDLTLEGPAWKISRRQGIISLRDNGEFLIQNEGKRPIFVDGKPVLMGTNTRLLNNAVIEIAQLKFIFLINALLLNERILERVKVEDVSQETLIG